MGCERGEEQCEHLGSLEKRQSLQGERVRVDDGAEENWENLYLEFEIFNQQNPGRGVEKILPPDLRRNQPRHYETMNYETKNFHCLSHSICDTLLWLPSLTNTAGFLYCLRFLRYTNIYCILRKTKYFHFITVVITKGS